jgi:pimeloyl-ACP methyl ester carboxylesterase
MNRTRAFLATLAVLLAVVVALPFVRTSERAELDDAARATAPGRFVELSHGPVHYLDEGPREGRPVVLVHGFSVPSYTWDRTAEALAGRGFRVIRYDLYGRGYSARPDVAYDPKLFVDQLDELLDALQLSGPVDLVGLSMGGAIGAAFTAERPGRVRRLALVAPFNTAVDVRPLGVPGVGEYLARTYFVPGLAGKQLEDFADPDAFPEWPARFRTQMRYRGFERALLSTAREFVSHDPLSYYEAAGSQGKPTLLVWGDRDSATPVEQADRVSAALGGPERVLIPGAGHALHYEHAAEVSAALSGFLGRP